MNKKIFKLLIIILIINILVILYISNKKSNEIKVSASVVSALSDNKNTTNFSKADKKIKFEFPKDSGEHKNFQTEWWYYTGNLEDDNKNNYGYQLTIFRRALNNNIQKRNSSWNTNQIYFAHFTLTDVKKNKFYYDEKYGRNGAKIAGANYKPLHIWLEDWQIKEDKNGYINLKAENNNVGINLKVKPVKPIVLQGDNGLSKKSKNNASYYYSLTRLETHGEIFVNNEKISVRGLSWLDREWSTSALSKEQSGWDWFSLQFNNNKELMLYQLRLKDGGIDNYSSGALIDEKGNIINLKKNDFKISVKDYWKSPNTNVNYPSKWEIQIPKFNLNLNIEPFINNQELNISFSYWEGAVKVRDNNSNVNGKGYVELTGYNEKFDNLRNR
jgi:predicted secreted hydrolase